MKRLLAFRSRLVRPAVAAVAMLAIAGGALAARTVVPGDEARSTVEEQDAATDAELAWVDPVVTGPVSENFERRRQAAGCDAAVWPNIPKACYPD